MCSNGLTMIFHNTLSRIVYWVWKRKMPNVVLAILLTQLTEVFLKDRNNKSRHTELHRIGNELY